MVASVLDWLRGHEGPLAYVVIGLAALIEYVFPPFPGDVIAIASICLALAAGYHVGGVYAALVLGALVGGQVMWWVGRRFAARENRPALLRRPRAEAALAEVEKRFASHGSLFLVVHRFVPALRAFVYVGAGMSGVSGWRVLALGGLSALAWNALLFAAGWLVAANLEALTALVSAYSWAVIALVVVALGVTLARRRART